MFDNQSAFQLIKMRNSMRSYDGRPLLMKDKLELQRRISNCLRNPFNAEVRLPIVDSDKFSGKKLGTYGVIQGAAQFIAGVVRHGAMDVEGLGYSMEHAILAATSMGLGTCWLAGTYSRSDFKDAVKLGDDERILCVSPANYPAERRTMLDTMMRGVAGSRKRKPWGELFFEGAPAAQLSELAARKYDDALEAVRFAPSGSNRQPWRVIKQGVNFHFFRQAKPGSDMGRVDMGIAACHFELVAREAGLQGDWGFENPEIDVKGESLIYCVSWLAK